MAGSAHSSSVLIIGGGLVAHAIAWRLARAGSEVTLLADGCAAASAASAGMLAPSFEAAHDRAAPNLKASLDDSLQQWDEFARGLEADSGMAIDYRRNGIVGLGETAAIGVRDPISVPAGVIASSAWLVPEEGQVDPRRALEALRRATAAQGVKTIVGHATRLREQSGRVIGVETDDGSSVRSDRVVLAAGMGSNRLLTDGPPLVPVRGRAFLVRCSQSPFVHVVRSGTVYFCPKADGTLYVGATEEGGDSAEKGDALGDLWSAATALYPALDGLEIIDRFDGTRPVSPTGLPHIGPALDVEGLYLAFGHDRNGVLLAPLTAARVAAWVTAP